MLSNRTYGKILIFSATALFFVGGTALAQMQQPGGAAQQSMPMPSQTPTQQPGQQTNPSM